MVTITVGPSDSSPSTELFLHPDATETQHQPILLFKLIASA